MPSTFEQNLTKIVADTKTYKAQFAKVPADVKAKDNNYRTVVSMIYEAQKAITELKADIKKGTQGAVDNMKKWQANYPKIFARLAPAKAEIVKLKKSLTDLKEEVSKTKKTAKLLSEQAARSAMEDVAAAAKDLATAITDLKTLSAGLEKQIGFLDDVPKEPNGVFV